MKIIIDIPDNMKVMCEWHTEGICDLAIPEINILANAIANGTILPKNHEKIVDLGKIDEDKINKDNPIITINIDGTAIEAISLDYLYNLPDLTKKEE